MSTAVGVSLAVRWLVVLALVVAVFALARQIGVLYERVAPLGALVLDEGPKVGDQAPMLGLTTLAGEYRTVGGPAARSELLFFLSPTCPVCKKLLPVLRGIARDEADWLQVVLASDGDEARQRQFLPRQGWPIFPTCCRATWASPSRSRACLTRCCWTRPGWSGPKGWSTRANSSRACSPPASWAWRRSRNTSRKPDPEMGVRI
jgi:thiol-disulfide isomerase/thioredoxin